MINLKEALQQDVGFAVLGLICLWWLMVHQWLFLGIFVAVMVYYVLNIMRDMEHCKHCEQIIRLRQKYCQHCGGRTEHIFDAED